MEITIFARKRTTKEGKPFTSYLTRLHNNRTGEDVVMRAKFREECGAPKADDCPMNISIPAGGANISGQKYTVPETGEVKTSETLWVSAWTPGSEYVDHSMDDYI